MAPWLIVSLLVLSSSSAEVAATLTEITAVSAAGVDGAEVVSTRDIEKIVALESQKQLVGCSASDCLAEVAGALGARLVVFSELGALDDQLVLTMNLYDADASRSVARELVSGGSATVVGEAVPAAVRRLLEAPIAAAPARPVRVLVMNIVPTSTSTPAEAPAPAGSVLGPIGLATMGVGGVIAIAGGIVGFMATQSDGTANAPSTTQREARAAYAARDGQALAANVLFGGSAVVAGTGAALYFFGME